MLIALLALTALAAPPAPAPTTAPALTEYMGRRIAQAMHFSGAEWLTRESRDREEDTRTMLARLGVKPGQTVCDMGCGNGFYTLKLAEMVGPTGKVLAVEIQPEMLDMLQARAKAANITNIVSVLGTEADPKLPPESIDLMLLVDVYHEFDHPVEMLAAIRKSLKPAGRLAQVEFRAEDRTVPIKEVHKMSKAQAVKELTANGFKMVDQFDALPWQHLLFFQRTDGPLPATRPTEWPAADRPTTRRSR